MIKVNAESVRNYRDHHGCSIFEAERACKKVLLKKLIREACAEKDFSKIESVIIELIEKTA